MRWKGGTKPANNWMIQTGSAEGQAPARPPWGFAAACLAVPAIFLLTRWLILVHNCNACTGSNNRQVFPGE